MDQDNKPKIEDFGILKGEYILPRDTPIVMKVGYATALQFVIKHLSEASTNPRKAIFVANALFEATCTRAYSNDQEAFSEAFELPFGLAFTTASKAFKAKSEIYQRILPMTDAERSQACKKLADAWFDTLSEDDYPH